MSTANDNNQLNQQEGGTPPIPSPQESPRQSREGTPQRSTSHTNDQQGDEQIKQLKEHNDHIEQILNVPPVIKGVDNDKYSQQPWKPSAGPLPIPKKFKIPDIPKYDRTTDPQDHVIAFTIGVKDNDLTKQEIESVLVKTIGKTLTKGALTLYSLLPENSIDSFAELVDSVIKAHSEDQKVEKRMEDIFKIKQGDTELLKEFVDRFQHERMMLPRVPDNWAAMTFASNLNEKISEATRRLKESLRELPATTWNDVYNSFNISTSELVVVLRSMGDKVRWLKEMRSNPSRRNPDFCEKDKQSYMKNRQDPPKPLSPKRTVNVISGGEEVNGVTYTVAKKTSKVTVTHGKRVRQVLEEDSIMFDDTDADGLIIPHNYALVISLLVHDINVKRVLIDPGSSVNIILLRVVNKMQADDKMVPKARTLSGFDNSSIVTKGEIVLTTFAEEVVKDTKF
ncbi:uncharacterized protein [Nicotiana tomentosiformis]|uniref:uncharacterized protein n=1 Tax=Nicotiana tomentosiformis TaxID=4098 RepID=UPI00388C60BF